MIACSKQLGSRSSLVGGLRLGWGGASCLPSWAAGTWPLKQLWQSRLHVGCT